MSEKLYMVQLL